jgi:tetratricopeptide (TPR) repeat protein
MKWPIIPCLCGLVLGCATARAEPTEPFTAANQQFQSGDYAGAAASYEKILTDAGPRAAVFYNLGNSYQRLGKHGPAILSYERARLLNPRDPDLLANLARARKAAAAFEENVRQARVEAALNYLSPNEWSWLVAGSALVLGGLALLAGVAGLPQRGLRQTVVATAVLACLAMALGASVLYLRRGEANRGIVLSDAATVRLSPFEKAESLGTPGPGRIVQMGGKQGDFYYIEVPGVNLRGWLASRDVAAIIPD